MTGTNNEYNSKQKQNQNNKKGTTNTHTDTDTPNQQVLERLVYANFRRKNISNNISSSNSNSNNNVWIKRTYCIRQSKDSICFSVSVFLFLLYSYFVSLTSVARNRHSILSDPLLFYHLIEYIYIYIYMLL